MGVRSLIIHWLFSNYAKPNSIRPVSDLFVLCMCTKDFRQLSAKVEFN